MQLRCPFWLTVAVLACVWLVGARAQAWTDARARSARVTAEVDAAGRAQVFVQLELHVRGGWLEGFEVSGLDPDAALDAVKPPVLIAEDGEKWSPEARVRAAGRVALTFPRRGAPRRGRYRLQFAYRTSLAHRATQAVPGARTRFTWTLPAWQSGLEDVEVSIWAPSSRAEVVDIAGLPPGERRALADRALLRFHRMHLPRATVWPVSFEVPDADLHPSLWVDREEAGEASSPLGGGAKGPPWAAALLVVACLFAFARLQVLLALRSGRRVRRVAGSAARAVVIAGALVVLGAWQVGGLRWLSWGLALVASASAAPRAHSQQRFGHWQRLGRAELRALRMAGVRDVLGLVSRPDPLSVLALGAPCLLAWYACAQWSRGEDVWGWWTLLGSLAAVWSSRRWGQGLGLCAHRLLRLAAALRLSGVALSCRAFHSLDGALAQPRLQVFTASRISGVQRLEVGVDERLGARGYYVLATTAAGAPADRWLTALGGSVRRVSPGARRVCHVFAAPDVSAVEQTVRALIEHCGACAHELAVQAA